MIPLIKTNEELTQTFRETLDNLFDKQGFDPSVFARKYLAEMLTSFSRSESSAFKKIFQSITLLRYSLSAPLSYYHSPENNRQNLRDLGDCCLMLTGIFHDFISRNGQGQVKYHYMVGSSSYASISQTLTNFDRQRLYLELAEEFEGFSETIRQLSVPELKKRNIMDIYNLFEQTKDPFYLSVLQEQLVEQGQYLVNLNQF